MSTESCTCAACGNQEPVGSQFCGNCGARLAWESQRTQAEPPPTPPPPRHHRRWIAVAVAIAALVAGGAVAAALALGGAGGSTGAAARTAVDVALGDDCAALSPVVTHLGLAADPSSADGWVIYPYRPDRDLLAGYADRAPAEIRPDVMRLRDFVTRYASAAQAAGAQSGQIPKRAQLAEIQAELDLSETEQAGLRTSVQRLLAWTLSGCRSAVVTPTGTATAAGSQSASAGDCRELGSVVADVSVGAHADDLVPTALDISASNYLVDSDFLGDFGSRAPAAIRADVMRLGTFLGRYASAAQAAGVAPGVVPTPAQTIEIRGTSQMGNVEQDQLPESIRVLGTWAAGGCTGGRPLSETTPRVTSPAVTTGARSLPVGVVDRKATEAVNALMRLRTEAEALSPPVGAEVRNCRKERDFSADSLLAPGGAAYVCEVWFEGERLADGPAAIDAEGNVVMRP